MSTLVRKGDILRSASRLEEFQQQQQQQRRCLVNLSATNKFNSYTSISQQVYAPVARSITMNNAIRKFETGIAWEPRATAIKSLIEFGGADPQADFYASNPSNASIGSLYYDHLVNGGGSFNHLPRHNRNLDELSNPVDGELSLNDSSNKLYGATFPKPLITPSAWSSVEDLTTPTTVTSNSTATSRCSTPATGWSFNEQSQFFDDSPEKCYDIAEALLAKQKVFINKLRATSHQFNNVPQNRVSFLGNSINPAIIDLQPPPPPLLTEEMVGQRLQKIRRDSDLTTMSESPSDQSDKSITIEMEKEQKKATLYKTEMCRNWEEKGSCRYGNKCQFAHAENELRKVQHHPKYKTEICKTFWQNGTCPYGKRCCFIHNDKERLLMNKRRNSVDSPKDSLKTHSSSNLKAKELSKFKSDPGLYGTYKNDGDFASNSPVSALLVPESKSLSSSSSGNNETLRAFTDAYFSGQVTYSPEAISPSVSFQDAMNNTCALSPSVGSFVSTQKRDLDGELGDDEYDDNDESDDDEEDDQDSFIIQTKPGYTPPFLHTLLNDVVDSDEKNLHSEIRGTSSASIISSNVTADRTSRKRATSATTRQIEKPERPNALTVNGFDMRGQRNVIMNTGFTPSELIPILGQNRGKRLAIFRNLG